MTDTSWYFNGLHPSPYYTPFKSTKRIARYIGEGNRPPTPKEFADEFNSLDRCHMEYGTIFQYQDDDSESIKMDLPGGTYWHHCETNIPERLTPFELRIDSTVELPGPTAKLKEEIKKFLDNREVYIDLGAIYKLGILAYGPPGNSKSLGLRTVIRDVVPSEAVCIFIPAEMPSSEFLLKVKDTLSDRLKVFVFEEFSTGLSDRYEVSSMLTFLDGELSPENAIIIATTNYPEELPGNMVDRPSRFDKLFKFDNPDDKSRKILIEFFMKRPAEDNEVVLSKGLSIAAIKEACIRARLNQSALAPVFKNLKDRSTLCNKAFAKPIKATGFGLEDISSDDQDYH